MVSTIGGMFGLFCVGIFILIFGGGGVFLIYKYFKLKQTQQASQTWPSTAGQVTEVGVDRNRHTDSDDDTYYTYAPRVVYTYQVNGQAFTSKNLTFGFQDSSRSQSKAQTAAARFAPGQAVTVFYNPANPAEAALERRTSGTSASLIIGIAFLAVGLCLCCPAIYMFLVQTGIWLNGGLPVQ
jgi:hypothetical protein